MKALGWLIAVSALLITVPRYASVFSGIDDTYLTALGMGVLLAGGAAYIFHAWGRTKRQDAWRLLVAFGLNLAYEPFIITPFVLARLWGLDLAAAMSRGYAVFWAIVVATAPVVLVGGVVLAISFQREKRPRPTKTEQPPSKTEQGPSTAEQLLPFACLVCGARYQTQKQLNGHMNKHRAKESNDDHHPTSD